MHYVVLCALLDSPCCWAALAIASFPLFAGWARGLLDERTANERGGAQAAPEGTGSESGGEGGGEGASGKVGPADFQLLRVVGQGAFGKARACPSKLCESLCWSASG